MAQLLSGSTGTQDTAGADRALRGRRLSARSVAVSRRRHAVSRTRQLLLACSALIISSCTDKEAQHVQPGAGVFRGAYLFGQTPSLGLSAAAR